MLGAVGDGNDLTDASPRGASGLSGAAERVVRKRRRRLGWQRNCRLYISHPTKAKTRASSALPCTQYHVRPVHRPALPHSPPHAPLRQHPLPPLLPQRGQAPQTHHHLPAPAPRGRLHRRHKAERDPPQRARRTARHVLSRRPGMFTALFRAPFLGLILLPSLFRFGSRIGIYLLFSVLSRRPCSPRIVGEQRRKTNSTKSLMEHRLLLCHVRRLARIRTLHRPMLNIVLRRRTSWTPPRLPRQHLKRSYWKSLVNSIYLMVFLPVNTSSLLPPV